MRSEIYAIWWTQLQSFQYNDAVLTEYDLQL